MFALAWEYLMGRSVATDPTDRQATEWPPHPDRIFQALVASWGALGSNTAEKALLWWLEGLGPPSVATPEEWTDRTQRHPAHKVFVPVNDVEGPRGSAYSTKHLAILPIHRPRHGRFFPSIHVGNRVCALVWPDSSLPIEYHSALERLCSGVTSLGHSSSMVRMWLTETPPPVAWVPVQDHQHAILFLRIPYPGRIEGLVQAYNNGSNGWRRPPTARWSGYVRASEKLTLTHGAFDERLIVLRRVSGDPLDLRHTLALSDALRKTLMPYVTGEALELISGHRPDGQPTLIPHVAYLPLPFVGRDDADGHLLGLALALPAGLPFDAENTILSALHKAVDRGSLTLKLVLGKLGAMTLSADDVATRPHALQSITWAGPARHWESVTPIVHDRMLPRGCKDANKWAVGQIIAGCERQGLPHPEDVEVMAAGTSICQGTPIARTFPSIIDKSGRRLWHSHALITFTEYVHGPILLGAGRFRGYGLCRPFSKRFHP